MASHVAPVLTIPQARALLAAVRPALLDLDERRAEADMNDLSAADRRALAAEQRSLSLAAEELRRVLPPIEGTP